MKDDTFRDPEDRTAYSVEPPDPTRGRSLTVRIAVYLTLALLPLGLIAVLQSYAAIASARESYRSALAAQTVRAARPESETILRAFGIARGLANAMPSLIDDPEGCTQTMQRAAEDHPRISFAGFVGRDQITRCNSTAETHDFSNSPDSDRVFAAGVSDITFNPSGSLSRTAVVIVSLPVRDEVTDDLTGFVSLSFPTRPIIETRVEDSGDTPIMLVTFDGTGRVLTSDIELAALREYLPQDRALADLAGSGQQVFTAVAGDGGEKDYAIVPIVDGRAYALGIWDVRHPLRTPSGLQARAISFPLLMWLASLGVAIWALRRLVILPVRALRMRMRAFADRRTMLQANSLGGAPRELREIGAAFERMANQIVRDEAELEDRVYEREVLLREVHHRVKNNLQLMSSIINMQIRQSTNDEAEAALQRVQGRLASVAKFHQDLYETSSLSRLRADQLLEDLARQMVAMGSDPLHRIDLRLDLDEVVLPPDQASPLAMLVTEALTNGLKYAVAEDGAPLFVALRLKQHLDHGRSMITVEVENSMAGGVGDSEPGLGTRLISAFAAQLDARLERHVEKGVFRLRLHFEQAPGRDA